MQYRRTSAISALTATALIIYIYGLDEATANSRPAFGRCGYDVEHFMKWLCKDPKFEFPFHFDRVTCKFHNWLSKPPSSLQHKLATPFGAISGRTWTLRLQPINTANSISSKMNGRRLFILYCQKLPRKDNYVCHHVYRRLFPPVLIDHDTWLNLLLLVCMFDVTLSYGYILVSVGPSYTAYLLKHSSFYCYAYNYYYYWLTDWSLILRK